MINDKDGHIPPPLIMCTCTVLCHTFLEWHNNEGIHPKASKSKLIADRPDRLNYLKYQNNGGKNLSSNAATGAKLLISPGVADTYTFMMNIWNTLLESYKQRVN
jgi:hypothetical protein